MSRVPSNLIEFYCIPRRECVRLIIVLQLKKTVNFKIT